MVTVSIPVTLLQHKESPLIEIVNKEEDYIPTRTEDRGKRSYDIS